MLEIEVKYPVADWDRVERMLREWKAEVDEGHEEADRYFNAPDRDFAKTDEAVRIRQIGHANFVTYKGPKTDAYKPRLAPKSRCRSQWANTSPRNSGDCSSTSGIGPSQSMREAARDSLSSAP